MALIGEARKEYARKHYQANKLKYAESSKTQRLKRIDVINKAKSVPCTDCGISYPYYVMDLDHVRGDKISDVSDLIRIGSFQCLLDEIDKCEPVCSNCHRIRTWNRMQQENHEK